MGGEQIGIHNQGNWGPAKNGGGVVSDHPGGGIPGADDTEYYGGYLIAESMHRSNIPIVSAAPKMLKALVRVRDAIRGFDITMANDIKAVDEAIAAATTPIPQVQAQPVPEQACEEESLSIAVMSPREWLELRRDELYDGVMRCLASKYEVPPCFLQHLAAIEGFLQSDSSDARLVLKHPDRSGDT